MDNQPIINLAMTIKLLIVHEMPTFTNKLLLMLFLLLHLAQVQLVYGGRSSTHAR